MDDVFKQALKLTEEAVAAQCEENPNAGNDFCRTCGCHFPPSDEELACRTWEKCREVQAPQSATGRSYSDGIEAAASLVEVEYARDKAQHMRLRQIAQHIRDLDRSKA